MSAARRNRPPEYAALLGERPAFSGFPAEKGMVADSCPIRVVDDGIVVGDRTLPFSLRMRGDYSKADLARLCG